MASETEASSKTTEPQELCHFLQGRDTGRTWGCSRRRERERRTGGTVVDPGRPEQVLSMATENCTLREKGTDQIRAEIHGKRPSVSYRAGSSRAHVSASMRYALGSMLGASPVHHKHPDQYRHPEHGPLCGCGRPQSMVLGLGAAVSENLLDVTCVRCLDASLERVAGDGPAKGGSIKPVLTIEDRCCVCGEPGCIDPTALGREGMCPACRSHHDQATANLETRGGRRAPPVDPVRRAGR